MSRSYRLATALGELLAMAMFYAKLPFIVAVSTLRVAREIRRLRRDFKRAMVDGCGLVCDRAGKPIRAEIRQAFSWTCEVCARVHYFEPADQPMPPKHAVSIAKAEGMIEDWHGYEAVPDCIKNATVKRVPSVLHCPVCGANMAIQCPCGCWHEDDDGDGACYPDGECDGQ